MQHAPDALDYEDSRSLLGSLAPCGPRLTTPSRDRLFGEPDRQATPLAQRGIVFRPVRHPMPLPRDVVSASGIGFERHSGHPTDRELGDGLLSHEVAATNRPICATRSLPTQAKKRCFQIGVHVKLPLLGIVDPVREAYCRQFVGQELVMTKVSTSRCALHSGPVRPRSAIVRRQEVEVASRIS